MTGNREHLLAPVRAPVKLVPFFPMDNIDNIGRPLPWMERLMHRMPQPDVPDAWYLWVTNQDRGMCAHPGLRNMLPDRSVVLSSFGLYAIGDLECFYPDRDVVIPAFKRDLGEARAEYYTEELKSRPDSALLFFAGSLKAVNPRCMGDSLLRSDCDSAYSQGVRMYIVSKYKEEVGFKVKGEVEISEEMQRAKFCLVAGGYGFDMRLYDAVSRGCVPLMTQQDTWQPLQHVLRYDRFALQLRKQDLKHLREALEAVPRAVHAKKVANLRHVFKAFAWLPGVPGLQGRAMAFYHIMTAVAIVTGLDLPLYVREMICTEHGEEFVLGLLTRAAQVKVLPCTIEGRVIEVPPEDAVGLVAEGETARRVEDLARSREEKQGRKPDHAVSAAKHFGYDK